MNSFYRVREAHEDVDRQIIQIVDDMVLKPNSYEQRLFQTLRTSKRVDTIKSRYSKLWDMYTDSKLLSSYSLLYPNSFMLKSNMATQLEPLALKKAMANLTDQIESVYELYTQLGLDAVSDSESKALSGSDLLKSGSSLSKFNGTEHFGRFFDLSPSWMEFSSLYPPSLFPTLDYVDFLKLLAGMNRPWHMPDGVKPEKMVVPGISLPKKRHGSQTKHLSQQLPRCLKTREYLSFLDNLFIYLLKYLQNLKPLADIESLLLNSERVFETNWISGSWYGWLPHYNHGADIELIPYYLNTLSDLSLQSGSDISSLNTLTKHLNNLKNRFSTKKVGNFSSEGIKDSSKNTFTLSQILSFQITNVLWTRIGKREALIQSLLEDELVSHLLHTVHETRRKQGLTEVEILREKETFQKFAENGYEEEVETEVDLLEKNAQGGRIVYGEDGEPLDYWLYKLHGLHIWFTCEICGDEKYRGPRAFSAHFNQWCHTYSLQSIGITNSPEFTWVTKISEAKELWNRLQQQKKLNGEWNPDDDEEFEDSEGNVYSKKVFDDLVRQGIIDP